MYVVPAPDGLADVDLLTIDDAPPVKPPLRAVHQLTLVLTVEPLTREEVMLVLPLGDSRGSIVQAVSEQRYKPGELSSGTRGPCSGSRAQLRFDIDENTDIGNLKYIPWGPL